MRCRACNAENVNSAKFCRGCGAGLKGGGAILSALLGLFALVIVFIGLAATAITAFQLHQQEYVEYSRILTNFLVFIVPPGSLLAVSIAVGGLDSRTAAGRFNAAAVLVLVIAIVSVFLVESGYAAGPDYMIDPVFETGFDDFKK